MFKILPSIFMHVAGQPIAIPFSFDEDGIPFVNASLPRFTNMSFQFSLKPKGSNWVMWENQDDQLIDDTLRITLSFPDSIPAISLRDTEMFFSIPRRTFICQDVVSRASRALGIGRRSSFIEEFGAVNFLQNSQQLILNDTDGAVFGANCENNSVFRTSFMESGTDADWVMTVDTGDRQSHPFRATTWISHSSEILHLPSDNVQSILEILAQDAADPMSRNCENARRRLPRIELSIWESPYAIASVSGRLILYPDDYTRVEPDGSCTLLIGTGIAWPNYARFNPLLVPNLNVRFTNDEIFLCDAIA